MRNLSTLGACFFATLAAALPASAAAAQAAPAKADAAAPGPVFTADGKLMFPTGYRSWIYLSTGLDMSYVPGADPAKHYFSSVFVNPKAYAVFQKSGHWPENSIMVLEVRDAQSKGSINKSGMFQTGIANLEVHVRDSARFSSGWGFFGFNEVAGPAKALPQTSVCNVCHEQHGAVDTTFVQFYPTLLPLGRDFKSLSAAYVAEAEGRPAQP